MSRPERRALTSRIPELSSVARRLTHAAKRESAIPLLYIEFGNLDSRRTSKTLNEFRAACKQATAAAFKSAVGSILRRHDLIAAGRGGQWFIALLVGRKLRSHSAKIIDADLGLAAERLRRSVQRSLQQLAPKNPLLPRVTVRSGWNVFELAQGAAVLEALRHAIRGAALVARIEERRATVLAAVTHELRTPLTAIIGFGERLQAEGSSPEQRSHWLAIITEQARRLHRLTEGLIDVGAWNAGSLLLRVAPLSLHALADDAVKALGNGARARGVCVQVKGDAIVTADHDRLFQVLTNLLDNAVRHTPEHGSVRVRVTTGRATATISIRDGGRGFSRAIRKTLGTPFRAESNGKTGLGLPIAKLLVDAHGGRLAVGAASAGGGLVTVTLPLEKHSAAGPAQERTHVCE